MPCTRRHAHPLHACTPCPPTPCKVVEYLRGLLDRAGATLGEPERAAVQAAFLKAVDIEIAFFDNAYAS